MGRREIRPGRAGAVGDQVNVIGAGRVDKGQGQMQGLAELGGRIRGRQALDQSADGPGVVLNVGVQDGFAAGFDDERLLAGTEPFDQGQRLPPGQIETGSGGHPGLHAGAGVDHQDHAAEGLGEARRHGVGQGPREADHRRYLEQEGQIFFQALEPDLPPPFPQDFLPQEELRHRSPPGLGFEGVDDDQEGHEPQEPQHARAGKGHRRPPCGPDARVVVQNSISRESKKHPADAPDNRLQRKTAPRVR